MTERNVVIHWDKVSENQISAYSPSLELPIRIINTVIARAERKIIVDAGYSGPYDLAYDTIIVRDGDPEVAALFVKPGDTVTLFGRRTTVCVKIAQEALETVLGRENVTVDPDGTFD